LKIVSTGSSNLVDVIFIFISFAIHSEDHRFALTRLLEKEGILRLLFITRKYPPSVGGMQKMSYQLVAELQKTIDVVLIALGRSQYHLSWFIPYALIQGIRKEFDAIHVGDGLLAPVGWLLSKVRNKPYTVTVNGLDITYRNALYQSVVIPFIRKANKVACISENTRNLCLERGCGASKAVIIPCGIPAGAGSGLAKKEARAQMARRYNIKAADTILLSVGRLVKRKGIAWFLQKVQPSLRNVTLIIAGEGPERDSICKAAKGMANVHILGEVNEELLQLLYRGSDAFIMPNIMVEGDVEGFGIVLLEAGQNGLYSFASDIDGIPAAVRANVNGRLLASGNAEEWIKALDRIEDERDALERMGEQARDFVNNNYSWERISGEYESIWKELLKKSDGP
jgi:phosphatidylinositol alpha-1,6-mannosyltransferase